MSYNYQYVGVSGGGVRDTSAQTCVLELKNTGTTTWTKTGANPVRLGTDRTQNHACPLLSGTLSSSRIEMDQASVAQNQNATFTFTAQFPASLYGGEKHYFTPVVDGLQWMTDTGMFWDWYRPPEIGMMLFTWYGPNGYRWSGLDPDFSTNVEDIPVLPTSPVDLKARYGHDNGTIIEHMGRYDSSDPDIIRYQLNLIEDANCSFVVLDYWPNHNWINDVSFAVAQMIRDEFPNLKYTFLVDGGLDITTAILDDLYTNGVATDNQFFKKYVGQKPTIYVWGLRNYDTDTRFYYEAIGPALTWPGASPALAWRTFIGMTRFDRKHSTIPPDTTMYNEGVNGSYVDTFCNYAVGQRRNLDTILWYSLNENYEGSGIEPLIHKDAKTVSPSYLIDKVAAANNTIKTTS